MKKSLNIVISGGGTGGHIFPAVAIANEIKLQYPSAAILFVGAQGKMEMEKVPKAGYQIVGLPIAGINRSNMKANLSFPFKFFKSLRLAYKTLKDFKPDMAIGVGGYASGPTLLMANFLGIKTLIQEQNSYAGITNKFLAKRAQKICVAYPDMEAFFPKEKIVFTGNPVRQDIVKIDISKADAIAHFGLSQNKKTLLIIGGSQGALSINKAINQGLSQILEAGIQIIWQTGTSFIETAKKSTEALSEEIGVVADFIYEMDKAYTAADIVVSRAGALSVSELCLTAKPAILVPFPLASEDHQTKNALSLVQKEAAIFVADIEANEKLVKEAIILSKDIQKQELLTENIKAFAKPNAAKTIVEEIKNLLK